MINLTGKSVFIKTQEEYLSVLKIARLQGFIQVRENHLNPIEIPFPNILNFCDSKIVTYSYTEKILYEASEIVKYEERLKDAVNLVRTFTKSPDRTPLTESFVDSLKLLADIVESQMEEVKQMERLTERERNVDGTGVAKEEITDGLLKPFADKILTKLADYEDLEEQGLLVKLPDDLNRVLYQVNYRWTQCTEYGEENNKCEIYDCKCECDSRKEYYIAEIDLQYISIGNYYDRLGKFLFLTREEAEKKLEEMKKNG